MNVGSFLAEGPIIDSLPLNDKLKEKDKKEE